MTERSRLPLKFEIVEVKPGKKDLDLTEKLDNSISKRRN